MLRSPICPYAKKYRLLAPRVGEQAKKAVVLCNTRPPTTEGLRALLAAAGDPDFVQSLNVREPPRDW